MEQSSLRFPIKIGIDLVYMPRMKKHCSNPIFLRKVFTDKEYDLFNALKSPQRQLEFLCGRFACKEAYAKARKTGIGETHFHDIEILKDSKGAPYCTNAEVSISHDGDYTIAQVMIYDK